MFAISCISVSADNYEYWSFYDCIWWGLMTLTTVGYHIQVKLAPKVNTLSSCLSFVNNLHIQPQTFLGKLSCGLCALCGVFIITLPIPIGQKRYSYVFRKFIDV